MAGRPGQRLHDSEQARLVGGPGRLGCHLRGRCQGRDHAAGGMEVMQTPGAALGSRVHESGHPAQLNSQSILKRHSRLKLPKSSSGSVPCQSKLRHEHCRFARKLPKFLPHPPTAAEHSYAVSQVKFMSRTGSDGWSPSPAYGFPRKGSDGPGPALPQGWVVPLKPHRVRTAGLRPYSAGFVSLG